MISFDFDYYRPSSVYEAVSLYHFLLNQGMQPLYYAGGTEIITMARINHLYTNAVIDLKGIPECNVLEFNNPYLVIGSMLTLTQLSEANPFPLLSQTAIETADQTTRNKITIGGNICGRIKYKEAILPFLLTDSQVIIASEHGIRQESIHTIFHKKLLLEPGEFIVQLLTPSIFLNLPYRSIKKRKIGHTGYPLLTVAALKVNTQIRFAFSGVCEYPFRSVRVEDELNNHSLALEVRSEHAVQQLPSPILDDVQGSAAYRRYQLQLTLQEILNELDGERGDVVL